MRGTKNYVVNEDSIVGLAHEVNSESIKEQTRNEKMEQGNNIGKIQAFDLAKQHEGSPNGDRWLLLSNINVGDPICIISRGKTVMAMFVGLRVGKKGNILKEWPFVAKLQTGGEYRWQLSDIVLDVSEPKTTNPEFKAGTIGELQAKLNQLLMVQNLDPNTKLYIASDAEGNDYNTLYNLQVEHTNNGKIVFANVNHNDVNPEEIFG